MATISRSTTRRRRRSRYNVFPRWVTRKRAVLSAVLIFSVLIVGAGGVWGAAVARPGQDVPHQPLQRRGRDPGRGRWLRRRQAASAFRAHQHRALWIRRRPARWRLPERLDHGGVDPAAGQPSSPGGRDLDPARLVREHPAPQGRLDGATHQLRIRGRDARRGAGPRKRRRCGRGGCGSVARAPPGHRHHVLRRGRLHRVQTGGRCRRWRQHRRPGRLHGQPVSGRRMRPRQLQIRDRSIQRRHAAHERREGADLRAFTARQQRPGIRLRAQPQAAADHRRAEGGDREHRRYRQASGRDQRAGRQRAHQPVDR